MHHILLQQQAAVAAQATNKAQGHPTQQVQLVQGQQGQTIAQPGQQGGVPQQSAQLQGHPTPHQPALQNAVAGQQQPHLKDYEQPRFYSSPMIIQQPSYLQMNPPNSQYISQSIIYPSYQGQQMGQVNQMGQMGQMNQQQVQQYFESVPVNNYMLMPGQTATNTNATSATSTPADTNSSINNYYGPTSGTYPQPPHLGHYYSIPHGGHMVHAQQSQPQPQPHTQSHMNQHLQSQMPKASSTSASSAPKNTAPVLFANFPERLQQLLPSPPLSQAPIRPEISYSLQQKRAKRKSKFSKVQDDLIVTLKKKGKSWVEIAEISGVGSYLAARNRYQVIVGQQGNNNSSSWNEEDKVHLQNVLDAGELEKWRFIALELNKATNKNFTALECREISRMLFWSDPGSFGVNEDTINECLKEKKMTEKASEQRDLQIKKDHELKEEFKSEVKDDKSILRPNASNYYSLAGSTHSTASATSQALPMPPYQMGINNYIPTNVANGTTTTTSNNANPSANTSSYVNYQKQPYY